MAVESSTFVRDILFYIKNDLSSNVTDPIAGSRPVNSKWVMTSYPQREAIYPLITLKVVNYEAKRAGMQTAAMDMSINMEIRIWARNTKERDELFTLVLRRLQSTQFSSSGSVDNNLHNFNLSSAVEIDEEDVKSKVIEVTYSFYEL
jgi:hypothetical protein